MRKLQVLLGGSSNESKEEFRKITDSFQSNTVVFIDESQFINDMNNYRYLNADTKLLFVKNVTKIEVLKELAFLAATEEIQVNKKHKKLFKINTPKIQVLTSFLNVEKLGLSVEARIDFIKI